jgi:hypothetical protein
MATPFALSLSKGERQLSNGLFEKRTGIKSLFFFMRPLSLLLAVATMGPVGCQQIEKFFDTMSIFLYFFVIIFPEER